MITHLAISGGGSSGIKFAGSLKYLEETNQLCNIKTILGTSIGAIIGVLLSYSTVDHIIENIKYLQGVLDINNIDLNLLILEYGFISKTTIIQSIEYILKKTFKTVPTLLELFKFSKKEVIITSFNLNKQHIEYFSYSTHPNVLVSTALSLSINIPFIFEKEVFNDELYVDAGIVNNLSWEYFSKIPTKNKLGIYLYIEDKPKITSNIKLNEYILEICKTFYKQSASLYEKSINLNNENILTLNEDISNFTFKNKLKVPSDEMIHKMLKHGYEEMKLYLKKKV